MLFEGHLVVTELGGRIDQQPLPGGIELHCHDELLLGLDEMTKKDRIALAISALYFLLPLIALVSGYPDDAVIVLAPLVLYWGWRFVKGDISFLKMRNLD